MSAGPYQGKRDTSADDEANPTFGAKLFGGLASRRAVVPHTHLPDMQTGHKKEQTHGRG